jgi:hypothetical protein
MQKATEIATVNENANATGDANAILNTPLANEHCYCNRVVRLYHCRRRHFFDWQRESATGVVM